MLCPSLCLFVSGLLLLALFRLVTERILRRLFAFMAPYCLPKRGTLIPGVGSGRTAAVLFLAFMYLKYMFIGSQVAHTVPLALYYLDV